MFDTRPLPDSCHVPVSTLKEDDLLFLTRDGEVTYYGKPFVPPHHGGDAGKERPSILPTDLPAGGSAMEIIQALMPLLMAVSKHQLDAAIALQVPTKEKSTSLMTEDQLGVANGINSSKLFFSPDLFKHAFGESTHPIVSRSLAIVDEALNPPGTTKNERITLSDLHAKALLSFKWGVGSNKICLANFSSTGSFKSMDDVVVAGNALRRAFTVISADWGPILDNMILGLLETYPRVSRIITYEDLATIVDEGFRSLSHAANAETLDLHPRAAPDKMGYHPQKVGNFLNITHENMVLRQIVEENRQRQYEFIAS
jgi:hypothetical protein